MTDNYLSNVILFNNLNKEERLSFLYTKLKKNGFNPKIQNFFSSFGEGRNIFTEINNDNQKKNIILSAHYDGDSLFDNAGGVIALLDLSKKMQQSELPLSVSILFTDQEESYQQGAAHFIKEYIDNNITHKNINVDGFGIGDDLFSVSDLTKDIKNCNDLFLCDSDEFMKHGILSKSYFSSFEIDFKNTLHNGGKIYFVFEKYKTDSFFIKNYNIVSTKYQMNKLFNIIMGEQ
jgi:hypothetical protein